MSKKPRKLFKKLHNILEKVSFLDTTPQWRIASFKWRAKIKDAVLDPEDQGFSFEKSLTDSDREVLKGENEITLRYGKLNENKTSVSIPNELQEVHEAEVAQYKKEHAEVYSKLKKLEEEHTTWLNEEIEVDLEKLDLKYLPNCEEDEVVRSATAVMDLLLTELFNVN